MRISVFQKLIWIIILLLATALYQAVHADEPKFDWKPIEVGSALLVVPLSMTSNDLPWGHAIELEGFSYAATDIFGRLLPKDYWFMAPIVIGCADTLYRCGEGLDYDLNRRKWACDIFGILGRVSFEF